MSFSVNPLALSPGDKRDSPPKTFIFFKASSGSFEDKSRTVKRVPMPVGVKVISTRPVSPGGTVKVVGEIAQKLGANGLTKETLNRWLKGRQRPSLSGLMTIARFMTHHYTSL